MQCAARLSLASPPVRVADAVRAFRGRLLALLVVLGALALPPACADDRIVVQQATLFMLTEGPEPGIALNAEFEFDLPWVLADAVNRGVALYFVADFEIYRTRWYWFDRRVLSTSLTYRLTYSPLTRQYRVARGALALPFDSLVDAVASIRRIRGWRVLERGVLQAGDDYRAQLRMRLDTSQLPRPFQINALTNRDWTLASDWRTVPVPAAVLGGQPAVPAALAHSD
jgi:hypothetical protein